MKSKAAWIIAAGTGVGIVGGWLGRRLYKKRSEVKAIEEGATENEGAEEGDSAAAKNEPEDT